MPKTGPLRDCVSTDRGPGSVTLEEWKKAVDIVKTVRELNGISTYLQMILDNSKALIVTTDRSGSIVEFNREGERLLGYTKRELSGRPVSELFEDGSRENEVLREWLAGVKNPERLENREVVLRSKSGEMVYMNLTVSSMVNDAGRVIGAVGIGKDISEEKRLQYKLMQAEKLVGIGTLASGIAHEINNPLAGVLGMAEAIRDEEDLGTIKEYCEDIIRYAKNAASIVRELSAYSRAATDDTDTVVDLAPVMERACRMASHSICFNPIEVEEDLVEGATIRGNEGELQQVFVNLIINAVQAMDGEGTLRLSCRRTGGVVRASVSDTGPGIPPEYINHIYDPFFTTKPVGIGTGLGLYVSYRIVTRHRGPCAW